MQDVLTIMLELAQKDDNVRAVLLEGSRAFGRVDQYSDFDFAFVCQSNKPWLDGAILPWFEEIFGPIAIMQTPDNGDPLQIYTHLVQFKSGTRIDITFNSVEFIKTAKLESGTKVLLDKDALFVHLPPASDRDNWVVKMDEQAFLDCCNEFYWLSPYVGKALARGHLLQALDILNNNLREQYLLLLAQLAASNFDWKNISLGKNYSYLEEKLKEDQLGLYQSLFQSYRKAEHSEIKSALLNLICSFDNLAQSLASIMGFAYNFEEANNCKEFIEDYFGFTFSCD